LNNSDIDDLENALKIKGEYLKIIIINQDAGLIQLNDCNLNITLLGKINENFEFIVMSQ
jgi:hypothetical protein